MDVGVQVPPRAQMMTPTYYGWGFCFTTLPRTPACAHTFYTLTPTLRSVASHPLPGSIRNLHHRLAGHNNIVISLHPRSRALAPSIGKGCTNTQQITCPPVAEYTFTSKVLLNVFRIYVLAKKTRRKTHAYSPAPPGSARYQPAFLYFLQVRDAPKIFRHDTPIRWHTALALGFYRHAIRVSDAKAHCRVGGI